MIKNFIKNIKSGVMNIFIYLIEKKQEELVVFFLITKKIDWEKDFKFVTDLGVTFQMLFNSIIQLKHQKEMDCKTKGDTVY